MSSYRKAIRAYDDARWAFKDHDYQQLYQYACDGLDHLSKVDRWPIIHRHSKETVAGSLYYFRAISYEVMHTPDHNFSMLKGDGLRAVISDYCQAIEKLSRSQDKKDSTFFTLLDATRAYAELCLQNHLGIDEQYAQKAINYCRDALTKLEQWGDDYGRAVMLSLKCAVQTSIFADSKEQVEQAIAGHLEALAVFEAKGNAEKVFESKLALCFAYYEEVFGSSAYHIEKTIYWGKEAINDGVYLPDPPYSQIGALYHTVGSAFLYRVYGESGRNCRSAHQAFKEAFLILGEQLTSFVWVELVFDWIKVLEGLDVINDNMPDIERRLGVIFSTMSSERAPEFWFDALGIKRHIATYPESSFHQSGWSYSRSLIKLREAIDRFDRPSLWVNITLALIGADYSANDPSIIEACQMRYQALVDQFDLSRWPYLHFYVHTRIAVCHVDLEQWQEANWYLEQATANLLQDIESYYSDTPRAKYHFPVAEMEMRLLAFVPLMVGDIKKSLVCFDYIYSRALAHDLETLDLIDQEMNWESLFTIYAKVKQHEFVLPLIEDHKRPAMLEFLKEADTHFDDLRAGTESISRCHFFSDLEPHLQRLDCWTLLPILSNNSLKLVLIPPHATLKDIYVSETQPIGFYQEMAALRDEGEHNWASALALSEKVYITQEQRESLTPSERQTWLSYIEQYENSFARIGEHLWDVYIGWLEEIVKARGMGKEQIPLCIIATGPLTLFPFAMAENPETGDTLIDFADVSYAPSLYVLFSLARRAKRFNDRIKLAYIAGTKDEKTTNIETEHAFVEQAFKDKDHSLTYVSAQDAVLESAADACSDSNHWHIATHGKYEWENTNDSYFVIGGEKLEMDILNSFIAKRNFRLAIAAACQSGLNRFITEGYDPQGFLYTFLEIGAIGAIGVQWVQDDSAASLLMGRFYYYYVEQKLPPACALSRAQAWLRNAKAKELVTYIEQMTSGLSLRDNKALFPRLYQCSPDTQPYRKPKFWAGFMLLGQ